MNRIVEMKLFVCSYTSQSSLSCQTTKGQFAISSVEIVKGPPCAGLGFVGPRMTVQKGPPCAGLGLVGARWMTQKGPP
ncbi:hypothetical protein BDZ45DRAFT_123398 [Acephala macrosclerotiorum]|nr:hypothetical protein BDZ45DRAFT_123398 [Acephala macrosclerotiorum]